VGRLECEALCFRLRAKSSRI